MFRILKIICLERINHCKERNIEDDLNELQRRGQIDVKKLFRILYNIKF
ncbi:MAG: hypothetical protein NC922_05970 [Candidatus Omnitrophica bacterium]|nr:hypothetical protein [Candidatus Omnitrophota bacterium]